MEILLMTQCYKHHKNRIYSSDTLNVIIVGKKTSTFHKQNINKKKPIVFPTVLKGEYVKH